MVFTSVHSRGRTEQETQAQGRLPSKEDVVAPGAKTLESGFRKPVVVVDYLSVKAFFREEGCIFPLYMLSVASENLEKPLSVIWTHPFINGG